MLVLVGVWLVEMIFRRTYRAPGELLFWTVVGMGLVALALNLTGDLLPWDQNSYWATRVRTGFLLRLSLVGEAALRVGGGRIGFRPSARSPASWPCTRGCFPLSLGSCCG